MTESSAVRRRDDVDKPVGLEPRREQLRRAADDLAQLLLAQRRHVDLLARLEQRLVVLQMAEEVGAQAHHRAQTRVGQRLREQFGEAPALPLLGAHVKLLALVDVEKEARRLGLIEFLAAALGGVDQIGQRGLAVAQQLDPAMLMLHPLGIGCGELPGVEERLHQRLERIGAGLERQKAPLAAVLKDRRPRIRRARLLGPGLALERRQHARLRQRGFAHAGIADEHRQPVSRAGKRGEHLDGFALAAEEIVAVLLLHRLEAAIGRRVAP